MFDISGLGFSSNITYRIQFDAGTGCWFAYYNYNTLAATFCSYAEVSGRMDAMAESYASSPGTTGMALTFFGADAGGTNQTLRLKGAAGYQDWTTSLLAGSTALVDDRTDTPRSFWRSAYRSHWYFKSYSNN